MERDCVGGEANCQLWVDSLQSGLMQIGIDCRLTAYQMGGISQYTIYLLKALAELDKVNSYIVGQMARDGRSHTPSSPNFRRTNLYTPCHHRLEKWALGGELLSRRLDVWHSPDFIPPAWGARKRVITVHDLNFIYYPQFLTDESKRYYAGQIAWACEVADAISADSEATRQDLIDLLHVPADKVTTIHLAANPLYAQSYAEEAIEATLATYNLPRGFILCVGTLEPRKNIPMLLKAYAMLRLETAVDLPLVLVGGKGWLYEEIFATIDHLQLRPHVHHLQGVYDEQLAHLYHSAGLLVTPSHYEGFGLPALEAMHCGCPVVVSDRGSLPEVVGEAGIILDPDDPELWTGTIHDVLTYKETYTTLTTKGFEQAKRFSWRETAVATQKLYQL